MNGDNSSISKLRIFFSIYFRLITFIRLRKFSPFLARNDCFKNLFLCCCFIKSQISVDYYKYFFYIFWGYKSNGACVLSCFSPVWLFATLWTVAHQAPLFIGFSRQEYWSWVPFLSPRGSSWPRDRTRVSCIVGRFFTFWASRETLFTILNSAQFARFSVPAACSIFLAHCQKVRGKEGTIKWNDHEWKPQALNSWIMWRDKLRWVSRNASIIGQWQFFGKVQRCLKRSQSAE